MRFSDELVNHIRNNIELSLKLKPDEIANLPQNIKAYPLKEDAFNILSRDLQNKNLSFIAIDGGNSSVIETNSFILDFVKASIIEVKNKKTQSIKQASGFISASYLKTNKTEASIIKYKVLNYSNNLSNHAPENLMIETLKPSPLELKEAINTVRKSIEFNLLKETCKNTKNSVILRDGSLIPNDDSEISLLKEIYEICKTNNNYIFGISKDSLIYTNYGNHLTSLTYHISKQNPMLKNKEWSLNIGETVFQPTIILTIALLDKRAPICLRIDTFKDFSDKLNLLTLVSNHPAFFGYPYPLIIADKQARVSNEETRIIKQFIHRVIKSANLTELENFFNSHKFLDTIK
ncbi:MAG: hypothetical protein PWP03_358 [Candidatus Woesearchaeota archaeon]|nr:hypothetical protein [Candidatus Woesearchaeota archaeon]